MVAPRTAVSRQLQITEGDSLVAAGIHSVLVQHLQVLPVEQHAATIARVRNLKTRGEAVAYLNEATQLLRSLEDTTRPPPPPPTSQLIFSATTLNFGRVPVGDVQAETLFIRNSTGRPVQIQAPERAGTFSWDSFAVTLLNNTQREVTVEFTPRSQGNASGAFTITSDSAGSPHRILLRGSGLSGASPR